MSENKYTKQHFVPKLLLNRFTKGKSTKCYVYDKKSDSIKFIKTRYLFQRKHYYEVENNITNNIEKKLNDCIESPMGRIIKNKLLDKEQINLNRKDVELIKKFTIVQFLRTDQFKNMMKLGSAYKKEKINNETKTMQWLRYI